MSEIKANPINSKDAEIAALRAQLEALQAKTTRLSVKVGPKGSVNIYGLNAKYPVCLYASQWERVIPFLNSAEFRQVLATAPRKAS